MDESYLIIKIIGLCVYLLLIFYAERLYREPLFYFSLEKIEQLQNIFSHHSITFFKYISIFGKFEGILPLTILIFNYFPLSMSYISIFSYIISLYFSNLLKLFYQSPRPYYINHNIVPYCDDTDYGNPSGHSLAPTAFYLGILTFLRDTELFKKNTLLYYIVSFILIIFIVTVMFSRLILGVHALNQLIFGATVGLGFYYLIFEILKANYFINGKKFFKLFVSKSFNIICFSVYFTLLIISLLCYLFLKFDHTFLVLVKDIFPHVPNYKLFENYQLANMLLIFVVIGAHSGKVYLLYFFKKYYNLAEKNYDNLNQFESSITFLNRLLRLILIIILGSICLLPYILVNKYNSLITIFLFKFSFPAFFIGFVLFAVVPIVCLRFKFFSEAFLLETAKNIHNPEEISFRIDKKNIYII